MITRISGKLLSRGNNSVTIDVNGLAYEVLVPVSIMQRLEQQVASTDGNISLMTYHYFQLTPSSGMPIFVGFLNEVERDFFLQFITVSGIGPRAAVKALNQPISEIASAIEQGDIKFLQTLPGIGGQKSKEIVAKLQGKIGRYGLIQDKTVKVANVTQPKPDWQEEALTVLLQLQYKRQEALEMMEKALARSANIQSAEELLNEIYKQRVKR